MRHNRTWQFSESWRQKSSVVTACFYAAVCCLPKTGGTWPSGVVGWIRRYGPSCRSAGESWSYARAGETSPVRHAPGRRLSLPSSLGARAGDGSKSLLVLKRSPPPWLFFSLPIANTHLWLNQTEARAAGCLRWWALVCPCFAKTKTTLSGGSLGSCVDEERSQLRELM